jgi:hypothetical protein
MAANRPAVAAIGPLGKLESYETFARRFGGAALSFPRGEAAVRPAHAAE